MISVRFQGKPFNITVNQVYAPTTNAKEAEVKLFYDENLPLHKNVHVNLIAAYSESPKKKKKTLQATKMAFNR